MSKNKLRAIYIDSNPQTGVNFFAIVSDNQDLLDKFQKARGQYASTITDESSDYFGKPKYSTKFKAADFNIGFSESGKIIHLEDDTDRLVKLVGTYQGPVADKLADRVADLIFKQHTKKPSVAPPTEVDFLPNPYEADLED
jgi:hypothetical protein